MQGSAGYQVESNVIHEFVDGEVLIVSLVDGAYYSLVDAAAFVWNALVAGADMVAVVAGLERRYDAEPGAIAGAVATFVKGLVDAGLLHSGGGAAAYRDDALVTEKAPFVVPTLDRYTDIEEHMKVDPVHEVDERGWLAPRAR